MEHVLLDSNIVIGIINGIIPFPRQSDRVLFSVSVVTIMEIYALAGMGSDEEKRIDTIHDLLDVIPLTMTIARRAGILARTRRRGKADLLIAATAIELGIPLLTKNVKDFRGIPGLTVHATIERLF